MRDRLRLAAAMGVGLASVVAGRATAGPFFTSSSPAVARPGEVVTFRGGTGIRFRDGLPLYLVPAKDAPRPYPCRAREGAEAACTPVARVPPDHAPYLRIGTVDLRDVDGTPTAGYDVAITFRVPVTAARGDYAYVMYCVPCAPRGTGGSLIAWTTYLRPGGWRDTSLVPAGPALRIR